MGPKGKEYAWSPKFAYALGLLTTDGSLSIDRRHINLTSKDKEQILNFIKCLGLTNKIGRKAREKEKIKKYYQVQFGNVIFYKQLLRIGLMPRKSRVLGNLKIPNRYFFHFLRGHLDGDGDVRRYQDSVYPNSERLYVRFCSASLKHLQWLQNKIKSLLRIKGYINPGSGIFYLKFAKKESLILLPNLYCEKNAPFLERKYKIVKNILEK